MSVMSEQENDREVREAEGEAVRETPRSEKDIAAELRLRPDPPRVMRLSRKAMAVLAGAGGLGLAAILIVALQDGGWHHVDSYTPERAQRPDTVALWQKITTVEDKEWTRRYHSLDLSEKAFGGRIEIELTNGERVVEEIASRAPFRKCRIMVFAGDLDLEKEAADVDREALLKAFRAYLAANDLEADWNSISRAENATLVNALSMMCPFGPREKQALLEAPSLKSRAEVLVAITEIELARGGSDPDTTLQ